MTLISCLTTSQQALLVNQAALSVVSNNISNLNTVGYSKQRVVLAPGINYTPINGTSESQANSTSGVVLARVDRYSDEFLQGYFRTQNSDYSYLNTYAMNAANIEELTNELNGTGLAAAFTKFYDAAQVLSSNPDDSVARANYVQQAQVVANQFNSTSGNLTDIRTSLVGTGLMDGSLSDSQLNSGLEDVNDLLSKIAEINDNIVKVRAGDLSPNSMLDRRDNLLTELSALIPTSITQNTNGTIDVSMNGINLVKGNEVLGVFEARPGNTTTPAIVDIKSPDGTKTLASNVNDSITSGSVGALLDLGGSDPDKMTVSGVLSDLNKLASNFASIINTIQTGSPNADGTTAMAINGATNKLIVATENIFDTSDGSGVITAGNIQVNLDVANDPYLIAAARIDLTDYADPSEYENAIGNNSNMVLAIESRTTSYAALDNTSVEGYLASSMGKLGTKIENINNSLYNQDLILTEVETQLSSTTGVNLDEELTDLIKYQNAYKAAARVFSVCNELLGDLVNLGR